MEPIGGLQLGNVTSYMKPWSVYRKLSRADIAIDHESFSIDGRRKIRRRRREEHGEKEKSCHILMRDLRLVARGCYAIARGTAVFCDPSAPRNCSGDAVLMNRDRGPFAQHATLRSAEGARAAVRKTAAPCTYFGRVSPQKLLLS